MKARLAKPLIPLLLAGAYDITGLRDRCLADIQPVYSVGLLCVMQCSQHVVTTSNIQSSWSIRGLAWS